MIKAIGYQQNVRLIIEKDGKRIADISMTRVDGCFDTDGFKRIETVDDPISMQTIIKAEV